MNEKSKTESTTYQVYLAKYSYDPVQYSPNDNPDIELPLTAGDYLFIYGDMDEVCIAISSSNALENAIFRLAAGRLNELYLQSVDRLLVSCHSYGPLAAIGEKNSGALITVSCWC
jgi:hypothetical protein